MEPEKPSALEALLHALCIDLGLNTRDRETLIHRYRSEGFSFLSKTLPKLGKALDNSLETLILDSEISKTFHCKDGIPVFCGSLFRRIYHQCGLLRDDADISAIKDLRQLCYFFYKAYADIEIDNAVFEEKFVVVDKELLRPDLTSDEDDIIDQAANLIASIFSDYDRSKLRPTHGPGATADKQSAYNKYTFRKVGTLNVRFPFYDYFHFSFSRNAIDYATYNKVAKVDHGRSRLLFVPKDSRGPRTIACEPVEHMWIQKGIQIHMQELIENHKYTKGFVNFTDQEINQRLALQASEDLSLCTLDMRDASDRVSFWLVNRLFHKVPDLLADLNASRTPVVLLPSGRTYVLNKYAAMGNATTFPVEAIVFWALAKSIQKLYKIRSRVYVYGDDIITDKATSELLFRFFPSFQLKFNEDKSFLQGFFRESCGVDAYRGINITPVRMRDSRLDQYSSIVKTLELSNNCFKAGLWNTTKHLDKIVDELVVQNCKGVHCIPRALTTSGFLNKHMLFTINDEFILDAKMKRNLVFQTKNFLVPSLALSSVTQSFDFNYPKDREDTSIDFHNESIRLLRYLHENFECAESQSKQTDVYSVRSAFFPGLKWNWGTNYATLK